jgi:putative glutamine amidotransferase
MRPLIGIQPCLDESGRGNPQRELHAIDVAYARAIESCGGIAVYLPMQEDADALAARVDGLLVPGGGDFLPPRPYPESVRFAPVPERQRAFDARLLAAARARRIPVLGVCYGMQLLALESGGELVYDIESDLPGAGRHRLDGSDARHALRVEPGTRLAALLGPDPEPVNSRHHQAVASPGAGLRACARAGDGLIEAIEAADPEAPFCLGVQWHPESLEGAHRARLFGGFVRACEQARA